MMKKSSKVLIGVGSAIALTGITAGVLNQDENVETTKANNSNTDKTVANNKSNNKSESNGHTKKETTVASSETSTEKETVVSSDKTLPVTSTVETNESVQTVTKTNENPPSATVSVTNKANAGYTLNTATSLVDWMKAHDMDSSFANRLSLANKYTIANYKGTASQNVRLLGILNGSIQVNQPSTKVNQGQPTFRTEKADKQTVNENETTPAQPTTPVVKDEPKVTTPATPVVEEHVIEDPSQPVVEEPVVETPVVPETPVQPVVEEPEQPVVEEPVVEEPQDVITTKTTTSTEPIAYDTVYQDDDSLEKGQQVVVQEGQEGVRTITYKETYVNGEFSNKEQLSSVVTKNPVDKIIKRGTKEPAPQIPTMDILNQNGLFNKNIAGTQFYYLDNGGFEAIRVLTNGNRITSIHWYATPYKSRNVSKAELVEILGEEEGTYEYEYAQNVRKEIESVVRSAANAVYGSGTAEANALYNQILNSGDRAFSF